VKTAGVHAITPHNLRHTCAWLAVSATVNVLALQRMLGRKSAKMTQDTCADLFDDDLDAVAATLHARHSPESVLKMCAGGGTRTLFSYLVRGQKRLYVLKDITVIHASYL
jgi:hypothetical protein